MSKILIHSFFLCFMFTTSTYTFYNFYNDMPYHYTSSYKGILIIKSDYINYTNTNVSFCVDYTLIARSEHTEKSQTIVDWYFSPVRSSTLPVFAKTMLDSFISQSIKEVRYGVKLPSDHFLMFDRKGQRHLMGNAAEILFPIVDFTNKTYTQSYNVDLGDGTHFVNMDLEGWDFFQYKRPADSLPLPILETNEQFISKIYQSYTDHSKKNLPMTFWVQYMNLIRVSNYQQVLDNYTLMGLYFIDSQKRELSKAIIIGKIKSFLSYTLSQITIPIEIEMQGQFDIILNDQAVFDYKQASVAIVSTPLSQR